MVQLGDTITYCVCLCCIGCFFVTSVLFVFTHYPECVWCIICLVLMLYVDVFGYECYMCVYSRVGSYQCLLTNSIIIISKIHYGFEYRVGGNYLYLGG